MYVATWMSTTIPQFSELRDRFAEIVNPNGGTLKTLEKRQVEIKWTPSLMEHWVRFIRQLYKSSKTFLTNYDPRDGLVVLMDASETHWALILCQAQHQDIEKKDSRLLRPKPMMYLSGKFVGDWTVWTSFSWAILPLCTS